MSFAAVTIHITGIEGVKEALRAGADAGPMIDAGGRGVQNLVIRHLRRRNARPGKPGWPKSNYYEDAASSTILERNGDNSALITVHAPGLRLHLIGGDVKAKSGKAMAVPVRPEVAGIWPSEYSGRDRVFLLVRKAIGKAYLAEREDGGHLRILWRLIKKARHEPDPAVIPSESEISAAATSAIKLVLPQQK